MPLFKLTFENGVVHDNQKYTWTSMNCPSTNCKGKLLVAEPDYHDPYLGYRYLCLECKTRFQIKDCRDFKLDQIKEDH